MASLKPLLANDLNNRLFLISLILVAPATVLLTGAVVLTYLIPNEALKLTFYSWAIFNHPFGTLVVIAAPFLSGLIAGLPLLWRVYRENSRHLLSGETIRSLVRPENYSLIGLALLAGLIVAFISMHDSVHCFMGFPMHGLGWLVNCVQSS